MSAYYNENDEEKAAWLRELIRCGIVAPGEVDTRSITEVRPEDLDGFAQCHFFAGIGVWSYALRLAGWPDERPVWTGSCPCPSFSAAGKGGGFDDPRHLWPDWARLIRKCKPATIFGEQADDAIGYGWLDLVQTDLERENYAVGKAVLGACSVGAPQIRQRLYFVAHAESGRLQQYDTEQRAVCEPSSSSQRSGGLADTECDGRRPDFEEREAQGRIIDGRIGANHGLEHPTKDRPEGGTQLHREHGGMQSPDGCEPSELANADWRGQSVCATAQRQSRQPERSGESDVDKPAGSRLEGHGGHGVDGHESRWFGAQSNRPPSGAGFVNGFWRDADWVLRKRWNSDDWEWCPVEPKPQPMVDGSTESLGRLCESRIEEIEEEISETAKRYQADARKALHYLRQTLSEEALRVWIAGGLHAVYEAPVLLALLRQLADQGWAFSESISRTGEETAESIMRGVRQQESVACPPPKRGLDEQQTGKSPDLVRVLSSILARHAQEAWSEAFDAYAGTTFPLATGVRNRVLKLRGYGDAICAEVAKAFIEASMT